MSSFAKIDDDNRHIVPTFGVSGCCHQAICHVLGPRSATGFGDFVVVERLPQAIGRENEGYVIGTTRNSNDIRLWNYADSTEIAVAERTCDHQAARCYGVEQVRPFDLRTSSLYPSELIGAVDSMSGGQHVITAF